MTRKQECKEHIVAIWKISHLAKKCFKYSKYMHNPYSEVEKAFVRHSIEFQFIRHILWRNTVIELSKIFQPSKKRDRYNLFHFINKLEPDQYYGGLGLPEDKLVEWRLLLETNDYTIKKILDLRDKVYGHTDTERNREELDVPTFKNVENLFEIIENVIQEIYKSIFNGYADTEFPLASETPARSIRVLAEDWKTRIGRFNQIDNNKND